LSVRAQCGTAVLLLALHGLSAIACGHCIEDKVAAVYDYAVVMKALERKHHVAFFAIDGPLVADEAAYRAITAILASARGVDKGSARVSVESASLSFGFDPKRTRLVEVQRALETRLAPKQLSLLPLQVMDGTLRPQVAGQ
jgi:hypothetical protein